MTSVLYSPIVKGKLNDLKALGRASSETRPMIKPMVETMPLPKGADIEKHIWRVANYIVKHVPLGELYLDFYGLTPGLKMPDGSDALLTGFRLVKALGRTVTPTYGFGRDDSLWPALRDVVVTQGQGFCFRVDIDDLDDQAEDTWAQILERTADFGLKSDNIDLMIDLRDVGEEDIGNLKEVVLDFLELVPSGSPYRSVIVAGSSALKTVGDMPKDGIGQINRNELHLWSRLRRDLDTNIDLRFADYGVVHPDFSDQGPNKYMNAKIRYTNGGRITYFRGHGLRHPVKDYHQYHHIAAQVRDSSHYCGRSFSYGDWYIDMVADGNLSHGSPGTWVLADMNHHLEYTARHMPRLIERIAEAGDETELAELTDLV